MKIQDFVTNVMASRSKSVTTVSKASAGFSYVMSSTQASALSKGSSNSNITTGKQKVSNDQSFSTQKKCSENNVAQPDEKKLNDTDAVKENTTSSVNQVLGKEEVSSTKEELVENKVKEIITEDLQVTEEELETAMSVLALSYIDLLNPENLKALTLNLKEASDITEVLLDDDLSTMLTQVLTDITVENIAETAGVSIEDVKQLISPRQEIESKDIQMPTEDTVVDMIQTSNTSKISDSTSKMPVDTVQVEETVVTEETVKNTNEALVKQSEEENTSKEQNSTSQSSLPEVSVVKEVSDTRKSMTEDHLGQRNSQSQSDLSEAVVNNIVSSTVTETISSDGMITMTRVEMRQVVTQIVQQIRIVIRPEQTDMHMTLNPENLGRLVLAVTAKDGVMTANFTVQNEMVKQAMEAQIQDLKAAFEEQGLKVDAVEVTVSTFEFTQSDQTGGENEQSEQKKQRGNSLSLESAFLEEIEEKDLEEQAVAALSGTGNNVNYTV